MKTDYYGWGQVKYEYKRMEKGKENDGSRRLYWGIDKVLIKKVKE